MIGAKDNPLEVVTFVYLVSLMTVFAVNLAIGIGMAIVQIYEYLDLFCRLKLCWW